MTETYGEAASSVSGPCLLNSLPEEPRTSQSEHLLKKPKTYLIQLSLNLIYLFFFIFISLLLSTLYCNFVQKALCNFIIVILYLNGYLGEKNSKLILSRLLSTNTSLVNWSGAFSEHIVGCGASE